MGTPEIRRRLDQPGLYAEMKKLSGWQPESEGKNQIFLFSGSHDIIRKTLRKTVPFAGTWIETEWRKDISITVVLIHTYNNYGNEVNFIKTAWDKLSA